MNESDEQILTLQVNVLQFAFSLVLPVQLYLHLIIKRVTNLFPQQHCKRQGGLSSLRPQPQAALPWASPPTPLGFPWYLCARDWSSQPTEIMSPTALQARGRRCKRPTDRDTHFTNSKNRHEEMEREFSSFHSFKMFWQLVISYSHPTKGHKHRLRCCSREGLYREGIRTKIINPDTSKFFCVKQRRILFDRNQPFQPSKESQVFRMKFFH